jgi:hypothetical protein
MPISSTCSLLIDTTLAEHKVAASPNVKVKRTSKKRRRYAGLASCTGHPLPVGHQRLGSRRGEGLWRGTSSVCAAIGLAHHPEVLVSPAASVVDLLAHDSGGDTDNDEGGTNDPSRRAVRDADSDGT